VVRDVVVGDVRCSCFVRDMVVGDEGCSCWC
jgi:hypothetical protein